MPQHFIKITLRQPMPEDLQDRLLDDLQRVGFDVRSVVCVGLDLHLYVPTEEEGVRLGDFLAANT